jgi:hypothetical protein
MNEYIISFFNFNEEDKVKLKNTPFIGKRDFELTDYSYESKIEEIELSNLVGSVRYDLSNVTNLYQAYERLHKGYLYKDKRIDDWIKIVNEPYNNDLPEVVEIDSGYYHFGEGKHRLITSKILGFEKIKVIIKTIK